MKYFFMTNDGTNSDAELVITPFNAVDEQNDYEVRPHDSNQLSVFETCELIALGMLDPMAAS